MVMDEPTCRDTTERRDWTKLPPDLAASIAGRLLGTDLTEYIRFRSVCKPWRQSTDDPRRLHSRFHPRNWVVLVNYLRYLRPNDDGGEEEEEGEETTRKFRLLNVATGASLTSVEFPELSAGHYGIGYAEGLLVLWGKTASAIRLLNPLTHAVTDLPDFSSILAAEASTTAQRFRGLGVIDGGGGAAAAGASTPPTVVILLDGVVPMIACIRVGEPRWDLVDTSELDGGGTTANVSFGSVLSLRGRFYMSTSAGDVLAVELHPEPRLVYVIRQTPTTAATTPSAPPATSSRFEFFLAPSSNDHAGILMVRANRDDGRDVQVFEVDADAGKLVATGTVGADRAVFIGSARALSISTRLFPSIAAKSVYFCIGNRAMELLFYAFRLDKGWGEPACWPFSDGRAGTFVDPCNLDVYLAWCVDRVHVRQCNKRCPIRG